MAFRTRKPFSFFGDRPQREDIAPVKFLLALLKIPFWLRA